jgi:hypothetical protein
VDWEMISPMVVSKLTKRQAAKLLWMYHNLGTDVDYRGPLVSHSFSNFVKKLEKIRHCPLGR